MRWSLVASGWLVVLSVGLGQSHIAPTEAKSPAEELKSFKTPAGFEVQLVAAEPDIGKPIQIAFDAKGRLWATTSRHYPHAAPAGTAPTDKLFILSDFGKDGRANTIVTFADNLNIPIGILPLADGSCLVSEVGQIVKLTDTDGDGKADKKEPWLTGFGTKDTHGMMNSFLLQPDGWVYACHGFANESQVVGRDGSKITMQSGNTFRFRPDGTQVQNWSFGQVNPFGLTSDPWGNLYTADCHSKPITQLIPKATYSSFSKPHDGLGFAPHVTRHDHGSTALSGLAWYDHVSFSKQYRGTMHLGNVVTNRINSDKIVWKGSTPVAEEMPDLVSSSDPWFRPTDIKVGPDGAIYFADFYNRIIGHYEVDLNHPLRDKDRGRIWRVVCTEPLYELMKVGPIHEIFAFRTKVAASHTPALRQEILAVLKEDKTEPKLRRVAVEAIIVQPHTDFLSVLFDEYHRAASHAEDTHLNHAVHVALTQCMKLPGSFEAIDQAFPNGGDWGFNRLKLGEPLIKVLPAIRTVEATKFLARNFKTIPNIEPIHSETVGRYGDDEDATAVVVSLLTYRPQSMFGNLKALSQGLQSRGGKLPKSAIQKLEETCDAQLKNGADPQILEACDLAASLKLTATYPTIDTIATKPSQSPAVRAGAYNSLVALDATKATSAIVSAIQQPETPRELLEKLVPILANINSPASREALVKSLQTAPSALAVNIATGLAQSPAGSTDLLASVEAGKASPRLLQERAVNTKLLAHEKGKFRAKVTELTKGLPSVDANTAKLLKSRADGYAQTKPDLTKGKALYATNCANCHQLGGQGAKIGPQLDGIGNRGLERLLEDTLDPNRNVDAEFRTTVLNLTDGRTLSGLLLREEGQTVILADAMGKEVRVNAKDIDSRSKSPLSPMPANFDTALKPEEYFDLMAYLLEQRAK
ncbi:MAG: PVC-type heme-binding CxxCH protein [Fimbriiglobus sp.]